MNQITPLAAKFRRLREHLGKSRPAFAEMLGIPPTTLKNYELGYREAIPASLLLTIYNKPELANYANYLLDDTKTLDTLGVMDMQEAA